MSNSYSLVEWYGKYDVMRTTSDSVRKAYLMRVQGTGTIWHYDQLYARHYSYKTAMRHLRNLRASDPECNEDY